MYSCSLYYIWYCTLTNVYTFHRKVRQADTVSSSELGGPHSFCVRLESFNLIKKNKNVFYSMLFCPFIQAMSIESTCKHRHALPASLYVVTGSEGYLEQSMLGRHFSACYYSENNLWPPATRSICGQASSLPTSGRASHRLRRLWHR